MKFHTLITLIGLADGTLLNNRIIIDGQSLLLPRHPARSPSPPPARSPSPPPVRQTGIRSNPNTNVPFKHLSAPDIGKLSIGTSGLTHQKEEATTRTEFKSNPHDHPVRVRASTQGRTIIHVYKGNDDVIPTEQFYHKSATPFRKEFSDPKKIRLVMSALNHSEHSADSSGRKTSVTVHPGPDSKGLATSWSYNAGRKTKQSESLGQTVRVGAASSKIEAPVGADGFLQGTGGIVIEASNSPSTSPPGSPGKNLPGLPFASIHSKHWRD